MIRFRSVKYLRLLTTHDLSRRGNGKSTYHSYVCNILFMKSHFIRFRLFPFLLPSYKSYLKALLYFEDE